MATNLMLGVGGKKENSFYFNRIGIYNLYLYILVCIRGENPNTLRSLDAQARALVDCACWGQPLGSSQLWSDNLEVIRRVSTLANSFIISQVVILSEFNIYWNLAL